VVKVSSGSGIKHGNPALTSRPAAGVGGCHRLAGGRTGRQFLPGAPAYLYWSRAGRTG